MIPAQNQTNLEKKTKIQKKQMKIITLPQNTGPKYTDTIHDVTGNHTTVHVKYRENHMTEHGNATESQIGESTTENSPENLNPISPI